MPFDGKYACLKLRAKRLRVAKRGIVPMGITASGVGEGLFRAANFFMAGSAGGQLAAIGTPLATLGGMAVGGLLNVEADFLTFNGTLDAKEGFFRSFSRGASSALTAKSFGQSFLKGAGVKAGAGWTKSWWGKPLLSGTEKGIQTVLNNYDKYGESGIQRFGGSFYAQSFAAGFLAGGLKVGADFGFDTLDKAINNSDVDLYLFSVGFANTGADFTKKIALKSMNKEYKKYLKENKEDPFMIFFNGMAQLVMYQQGK